MIIKVHTYGILKDHFPEKCEVDINNLEELLYHIQEVYPKLSEMDIKIAVNDIIVNMSKDLNPNDIVAIITPYTIE